MASSSRRGKRNNKRNHKQQSRSSSGSESTAPTYLVEEDSQGELVNRRMGVAWPTKVHSVKRYPDHSSGQSLASSDGEDQFKTSPYEMASIADLNEAAAADDEKRAAGGRKPRGDRSNLLKEASSPQYESLSNQSEEENTDVTDVPKSKIDSIVFESAEELDRYQRIFKAAAKATASETSTANSAMTSGEGQETYRHFLGVRSKRAVDRKLDPGQFFIYYEKPPGAEMPVTIDLKIAYMTSSNQIYHFPIQRYANEGETYYAVMQTDNDVKMFPSIASLVQHYHSFSNLSPESGGLDFRLAV